VESFISLTWSQDVEESEARALVYTVTHLVAQMGKRLPFWFQFQSLPQIRPFGDWVILMMPRGAAYSSMDWYIERSIVPDGDALDGAAYLRLVEMEPWQSSTPHFDLALVGRDLNDAHGQSVLSVVRGGIAAVISVYQLRHSLEQEERIVKLSHLVAHSLGRVVGIPLPRRKTGLLYVGEDIYCAHLCAMRPIMGLKDLVELSEQISSEWGFYCETCQSEMRAVFVSKYYGIN
jgi:hypothetical protein